MQKLVCWFLLIAGFSYGVEEKTAEVWIEELTSAYAELDGFVVRYHSEGENKELNATIAMHKASGLSLGQMVAIKDGNRAELRSWTTTNDELFYDGNGQRLQLLGAQAELEAIGQLLKKSFNNDVDISAIINLKSTPNFRLSETSVILDLGLTSRDTPAWRRGLGKLSLDEVTDQTVSFRSPIAGSISIDRKTGIMVSQSLAGEQGEPRLLTLASLRTNPTEAEVAELSRDWTILGAQTMPLGMKTAEFRRMAFQLLIDATADGQADLGKLESTLDEQENLLRKFASSCLTGAETSVAESIDWKRTLGDLSDALKKQWLLAVPEADADDTVAFDLYRASPEIREGFREGIMKLFEPRFEKMKDPVMKEIFGNNPRNQLKAEGEVEEAALACIEKAIFNAYVEAVADRKMSQFWGEREGLD